MVNVYEGLCFQEFLRADNGILQTGWTTRLVDTVYQANTRSILKTPNALNSQKNQRVNPALLLKKQHPRRGVPSFKE